MGAGIAGAYITQVYIPQHKRDQRMAQLKGAGLTEEQAQSFHKLYGFIISYYVLSPNIVTKF
ncbi:MAG: hypothetical protein QXR42_03900 [Candidatus Bathyarchaeia archaeon]